MNKTGKICTALVAAVYGIMLVHDAVMLERGWIGSLEFTLNTVAETALVIAYIIVMCLINRRSKNGK